MGLGPQRNSVESYFLSLRVFLLLGRPCEPATILPETLAPFISLASISVYMKVQEVAEGHVGS